MIDRSHALLCDGQDCRITELTIVPGRRGTTSATVDVRFRNLGRARHLILSLSKGAAGWRVSEIVNSARSGGWRLSAVLAGSDR